jgi:hypothetical protein
VSAGYQFEEKIRGASPRDAPTLEWEGRERGLEEGVNEGAGRRLGVPTDGDLACVLFLKPGFFFLSKNHFSRLN